MGPTRFYHRQHWQILLGMLAGVALGLFAGRDAVPYYSWMGDLFLRLLKMLVVPLIASSIIVGIAQLGDSRRVGRMGFWTLVYYTATSALAIVTGLVLVNILRPGEGADLGIPVATGLADPPSFRQLLLQVVPENPLGEMAMFGMPGASGAGLLGVIFFCILFGMGATTLPGRQRDALLGFFEAGFAVMMRLTGYVIRLAPLGVMALLGKVVAETGTDVFVPLLGYMGTVILGLAVHFFVTLPFIIWVFGHRNPFVHMKQVGLALATAFTTASSNATLPVSLEVSEKKAGVDRRVGGFVLPLGATVNMDGSALYEGVAALFIAQVYGHHLGLAEQAIIFVTVLLASVGAAGIPHASLVMLAIVFQAVGLPLDAIGLLLGVDRLLTMCRTATNVWGDLAGAAVIAALEGRSPGDAPSGGGGVPSLRLERTGPGILEAVGCSANLHCLLASIRGPNERSSSFSTSSDVVS